MPIPGPVKAAVFAAAIVGFASYLAENSRPLLAGVIATLPVALPAMWFLSVDQKGISDFHDYAWAFALGITAYFISAMTFYYLCAHRKIPRKRAILYAMGLWFTLAVVIYFVLAKRPPHR